MRDTSHATPGGSGADGPAVAGSWLRRGAPALGADDRDGRPVTRGRALFERFGRLICEFAEFGVVGVAGLFVTNAVYGLFFIHLGAGPVTSATIATLVAMIVTYLGNRYWSFRARQRTGVVRELIIFAVLNGIGLLIQDAAVAVNFYLLHLGHDKVAGFVALNLGIALATLFRFWSYRRFVWAAPPAPAAGHAQGQRRAGRLGVSGVAGGNAHQSMAAGRPPAERERP